VLLFGSCATRRTALERGYAYLVERRWDRAVQEFTRVIEETPELAEAYVGRGRARIGEEQTDQALRDLDRAIELDPGNATAYAARGVVYAQQERWDPAMRDYGRWLAYEDGWSEFLTRFVTGDLDLEEERAGPVMYSPIRPHERLRNQGFHDCRCALLAYYGNRGRRPNPSSAAKKSTDLSHFSTELAVGIHFTGRTPRTRVPRSES